VLTIQVRVAALASREKRMVPSGIGRVGLEGACSCRMDGSTRRSSARIRGTVNDACWRLSGRRRWSLPWSGCGSGPVGGTQPRRLVQTESLIRWAVSRKLDCVTMLAWSLSPCPCGDLLDMRPERVLSRPRPRMPRAVCRCARGRRGLVHQTLHALSRPRPDRAAPPTALGACPLSTGLCSRGRRCALTH